MSLERGGLAEAGLDVELVAPSEREDGLEAVTSGALELAITSPIHLLGREPEDGSWCALQLRDRGDRHVGASRSTLALRDWGVPDFCQLVIAATPEYLSRETRTAPEAVSTNALPVRATPPRDGPHVAGLLGLWTRDLDTPRVRGLDSARSDSVIICPAHRDRRRDGPYEAGATYSRVSTLTHEARCQFLRQSRARLREMRARGVSPRAQDPDAKSQPGASKESWGLWCRKVPKRRARPRNGAPGWSRWAAPGNLVRPPRGVVARLETPRPEGVPLRSLRGRFGHAR